MLFFLILLHIRQCCNIDLAVIMGKQQVGTGLKGWSDGERLCTDWQKIKKHPNRVGCNGNFLAKYAISRVTTLALGI